MQNYSDRLVDLKDLCCFQFGNLGVVRKRSTNRHRKAIPEEKDLDLNLTHPCSSIFYNLGCVRIRFPFFRPFPQRFSLLHNDFQVLGSG